MSHAEQSTQTVEQIQSGTETAESVVNTSTPLGWADIAIAAVIVAVAFHYLYRKLWRRRGQCEGCASKGKEGCAVNKVEPPKMP
ncbi:hypothetical protein ThidrDRAFT_2581 [Thiorhodococcus drewsii AZ1]|uniref:FeoB-associated Cys-rich membrane protein n=1 Tax=Thiorhodococcus drewsii AZ1 TaxID=765913 RepID=G2E2R8_9GAMM|nr:hypothetical protein [Thiorhodococcus drewsii]EGV30622.1 hypothetical protein ThidrDRAFT_2581 [Thiorhodococcus drewsii AZ1]